MKFKAAALQMVSTNNVPENLAKVQQYMSQAQAQDVDLLVLPENFALMGENEHDKLAIKEQEGDGPIQAYLSQLAKQYKLWIVGGTLPLMSSEPDKVYAGCCVFNSQGQPVCTYHKIHLFDVKIPSSAEFYCESDTIAAGERVVCFDSPFGRVGLSVCYDLRFPELYRQLAHQNVDILAICSAFTQKTGEAHWHILNRARAIENLSMVISANQGGFHPGGRATFGHSMIVDAWGNILATLDSGEGLVVAEVDLAQQKTLRESFPVISHAKLNK